MLKRIKQWCKKHKKAVFVTVTILSIVGTVAVILIDGKKVKIPLEDLANSIVPEPSTDLVPNQSVKLDLECVETTFERRGGIRNLHGGRKASLAKIAGAKERNIELKPGQTWVVDCTVTRRYQKMGE